MLRFFIMSIIIATAIALGCGPLAAADLEPVVQSVVEVRIKKSTIGSAWVVSDEGYVITASHVARAVKDRTRVVLRTAQGEEMLARVIVAGDFASDVALLYVYQREGMLPPPLKLWGGDLKPRGTDIYLVGHPSPARYRVHSGIISGYIQEFKGKNYNIKGLLLTDAPTYPGNSGCPIVLEDGTVVGMVFGNFSAGKHPTANDGFCGGYYSHMIVALIVEELTETGQTQHLEHFLRSIKVVGQKRYDQELRR